MTEVIRSADAGRYRVRGFRLLRQLGRGGLARTWLAEQVDGGKLVAIKELHLSTRSQTREIELFERECVTLSGLDHPQIPRFIDTVVERRDHELVLYLVQEYVDGPSLLQLMQVGYRFSPEEVVAVMRSCLGPLRSLHGRQPPIFHRDLKPGNILVRPDGECALIDFGAVRNESAGSSSGNASVVGTFGYMAPEQFQAQACAATDLYGLGATALHLLTNREPVRFELVRLKPDIRAHVAHAPALGEILDRLLEPTPEDRYPDVDSLDAALEGWCRENAPETGSCLASGRVAQFRLLVELESYRQEQASPMRRPQDGYPGRNEVSPRSPSGRVPQITRPVRDTSSGPFLTESNPSSVWQSAGGSGGLPGRSPWPPARRFPERTPASGNHDAASIGVESEGYLVQMPGLTEAEPVSAEAPPSRRTNPGLLPAQPPPPGSGPSAIDEDDPAAARHEDDRPPSRRTNPGLAAQAEEAVATAAAHDRPPSRRTNPDPVAQTTEAAAAAEADDRPPSRRTNPGLLPAQPPPQDDGPPAPTTDGNDPASMREADARSPSRRTNPGLAAQAADVVAADPRPPSSRTSPGLAATSSPTSDGDGARRPGHGTTNDDSAVAEAENPWSEEEETLPRMSLEDAVEHDLPEIWARREPSFDDVELPPVRVGMRRSTSHSGAMKAITGDEDLAKESRRWTGQAPLADLDSASGEPVPDPADVPLPAAQDERAPGPAVSPEAPAATLPEPEGLHLPLPRMESRLQHPEAWRDGALGATAQVPVTPDPFETAVTGQHRSTALTSESGAAADTDRETDEAFEQVLRPAVKQASSMPEPGVAHESPAAAEARAEADPAMRDLLVAPDVAQPTSEADARTPVAVSGGPREARAFDRPEGGDAPDTDSAFTGPRRAVRKRKTITLTLHKGDDPLPKPRELANRGSGDGSLDEALSSLPPEAARAAAAVLGVNAPQAGEANVLSPDEAGAAATAEPASLRPSGRRLQPSVDSPVASQRMQADTAPARITPGDAPHAVSSAADAQDTEGEASSGTQEEAPAREATSADAAQRTRADTSLAKRPAAPAESSAEELPAASAESPAASAEPSSTPVPPAATAAEGPGPEASSPALQPEPDAPAPDAPDTTFDDVEDPSGAFVAFNMTGPSSVVRRRVEARWWEPFVPGGQSAAATGLYLELLGVGVAVASVWLADGALPGGALGLGAVLLLYGIVLTLVPRRGAAKAPGRRTPSSVAPVHRVVAVERRVAWTGSVEWWAEYRFETPEQWSATGRIRLRSGATARRLFRHPDRTRVHFGLDDPDAVSTLLLDTAGPPLVLARSGRSGDAES
ncbi:MAG: serine/threonine protein kinase [Deltaproteobacteria bacterium]|nr:MAG: serine/threonine protein kinase [Deltaproteobacteria bacterium]